MKAEEMMQKQMRTLKNHCLLLTLALSLPAAAQSASASDKPASEQSFSGCVQRSATDKDTLILSTDSVCATLGGKVSGTQIAGHQVDLKGVLTPRTPAAPASIQVGSVVSVGKECSDVCSLRPPGSRGLQKGGEMPGKEGGTPGEVNQPRQP
jgi:hypothetical protein